MKSSTLSLDAEQSCTLINETLGAHEDTIASITSRRASRRRFPSPTGSDRAQIQRQATLVRFLSITESFSSERLLAEMDTVMSTLGHEGALKMWEGAHKAAIQNWANQKDAYNKWLGVPSGSWTKIIELTNARNAVAHGSGQLTWMQQRGQLDELKVKLGRHLIALDGIRIVLTEDSIKHAAQTCIEFITTIDGTLRP